MLKSAQKVYYIDLFPDVVKGLDALPKMLPKRRKLRIVVRCHDDTITCFQVKLTIMPIPLSDEKLIEILLAKQMQNQHGVDVQQCYWDWTPPNNGDIRVYVIMRQTIDKVLRQLPVYCQVEAIVPHVAIKTAIAAKA